MPHFIIDIIMSQQFFIISMLMPSIGIILQVMPSLVISHFILHIIMGIMPIGMPPIIGIPIPMVFIMFMGIPIMFMGIPIMFMGIPVFIIGIAFIWFLSSVDS